MQGQPISCDSKQNRCDHMLPKAFGELRNRVRGPHFGPPWMRILLRRMRDDDPDSRKRLSLSGTSDHPSRMQTGPWSGRQTRLGPSSLDEVNHDPDEVAIDSRVHGDPISFLPGRSSVRSSTGRSSSDPPETQKVTDLMRAIGIRTVFGRPREVESPECGNPTLLVETVAAATGSGPNRSHRHSRIDDLPGCDGDHPRENPSAFSHVSVSGTSGNAQGSSCRIDLRPLHPHLSGVFLCHRDSEPSATSLWNPFLALS